MATNLRVTHRTEYHYDRPVSFGPHRLMIRPRDGHDLRLLDSSLTLVPQAEVSWHFDSFGNSVALARFVEPSRLLMVQGDLLIRRYPSGHYPLSRETQGTCYPITYDDEERIDLASLMALQHVNEADRIQYWLDAVFCDQPDEAFVLLGRLSEAIYECFFYSPRDELGTQSPATTIDQGRGTCRDFAFLFMEAARILGFAARFVTGYLHNPQVGSAGHLGGDATHAWADVYIPGRGWIEFDPTNHIIAGADLLRVAATRTPAQASPVRGTWVCPGAKFLGMEVYVRVAEDENTQSLDGS